MNSGSRHSMRGELTPPQMTSSRLEPEKLRRPKDTPFRQQKVKSWLPILQPRLVVGIFLAIGIVFIPVGKWFMDQSDKVSSGCGVNAAHFCYRGPRPCGRDEGVMSAGFA
ncbi:unnamed protein product [Choristocarpus tenellus]